MKFTNILIMNFFDNCVKWIELNISLYFKFKFICNVIKYFLKAKYNRNRTSFSLINH